MRQSRLKGNATFLINYLILGRCANRSRAGHFNGDAVRLWVGESKLTGIHPDADDNRFRGGIADDPGTRLVEVSLTASRLLVQLYRASIRPDE
ncbi:hypothetical protein [Paracoccus sp. SCSIO 75233]|uniref:hypothetical protein n=1 Tax=Paracoccus sp. SCSIO 75233 TaxID=3017782 RepID=UPI0022EFF1E5|nr:hypothetical protein [Paracoccus sp. SCSIO 75233]WBU55070.1 hypothetical protein PAF12_17395 [Paracoccus sp. SCSIO 75233]